MASRGAAGCSGAAGAGASCGLGAAFSGAALLWDILSRVGGLALSGAALSAFAGRPLLALAAALSFGSVVFCLGGALFFPVSLWGLGGSGDAGPGTSGTVGSALSTEPPFQPGRDLPQQARPCREQADPAQGARQSFLPRGRYSFYRLPMSNLLFVK